MKFWSRICEVSDGAFKGATGVREIASDPVPVVSIIVVTVNTPPLTRRCLKSVLRDTSVPYELIVVNNSRAAPIRRLLRGFPGIRVIQNSKNLGYARAANQGAILSRGEYLCFLNSDTVVPPGWLERLLAVSQGRGVGAVTTVQRPPRFRYLWERLVAVDENLVASIDKMLQRSYAGQAAGVKCFTGFCVVIPRVVMARVGLFDERLFFGFEDYDYSHRLMLEGYRILASESVFIYHQGSGSHRPERRARLKQKAWRLYLAKWQPLLGPTLEKYFSLSVKKGILHAMRQDKYMTALNRRLTRLRLHHREHPGFIKTGPPFGSFNGKGTGPLTSNDTHSSVSRVDVTVMMAAHNSESWVGGAIESVLAQRFRSFELVIVDDGSTDRTAQIVQSYARHPQVRFFLNPRQLGIARTRNRILWLARGKYVAVCDADDVMRPTLLGCFFEILEAGPEVGWVYGSRIKIDEDGRYLGIRRAQPADGEREFRLSVVDHAGAMIRRELMLEVGGYDETLMSTEDYDLALKIGECSRLLCLPREIHYLYRRYPKSTSRTNPWASQETERLLKLAQFRRVLL